MNDLVEGVLHVDKPSGPTSHDVVDFIRRVTGIRRVGHSGTLDPLASGLLILCLGRATRLVEYLVGLDKAYLADVHLGQVTDTYDREGQVIREQRVAVTVNQIANVLGQFSGEIIQVPPMYSAVKVEGQPLYKRARAGIKVERPSRKVTVHHLKLLAWNPPVLTIDVNCSSGTYIRSIAHDIGQVLGCGAHLSSLRRMKIGESHVKDAIPLGQLEEKSWRDHLKPLDSAAGILPSVTLTLEETTRVSSGLRVPIREQPIPEDTAQFRAYNQERIFVGIVQAVESQWKPRKIFYQPEG